MPERLEPALWSIRANLLRPRLSVAGIEAVLDVKAHDDTYDFGRTARVSIRDNFTDRPLEAAARLLVDTRPWVEGIGVPGRSQRLRGPLPRLRDALRERPPLYRELEGKLSLEVAGGAELEDSGADLPSRAGWQAPEMAAMVAAGAAAWQRSPGVFECAEAGPFPADFAARAKPLPRRGSRAWVASPGRRRRRRVVATRG